MAGVVISGKLILDRGLEKMLRLGVFLACLYVCYGGVAVDPVVKNDVIPIVSEEIDVSPDGSFKYSFETGNGIKVHEEGVPKPIEKGEISESISGSYEYPSPDGKNIKITYTADETGYHPEGPEIPVAPPIPEPIQRALRYLADHPQPQQKELGEPIH